MILKNCLRLLCCLYLFSTTSNYAAAKKPAPIASVMAYSGEGDEVSNISAPVKFPVLISREKITGKKVYKQFIRPTEETSYRNFSLANFFSVLGIGTYTYAHRDTLSIPSFLRPSNSMDMEILTISDKPKSTDITTTKQGNLENWLMTGAMIGTVWFGVKWLLATRELAQCKRKYSQIYRPTGKQLQRIKTHLTDDNNNQTFQYVLSKVANEEDKVANEEDEKKEINNELHIALAQPTTFYPIVKVGETRFPMHNPTIEQIKNMVDRMAHSALMTGKTDLITPHFVIPTNNTKIGDRAQITIAHKAKNHISEFDHVSAPLKSGPVRINHMPIHEYNAHMAQRTYTERPVKIPVKFASKHHSIPTKSSWKPALWSPFDYLGGYGKWLIGCDKK